MYVINYFHLNSLQHIFMYINHKFTTKILLKQRHDKKLFLQRNCLLFPLTLII